MHQLTVFDYATLDTEARIVVQQRAGEIRSLIKRTTQDIIEVGAKLIEVKARLPRGAFDGWAQAELGLERATAYRFIAVAERFGQSSHIETIAPSALYLLASASVPEEARQEAATRAAAGERIDRRAAQQIVAQHRPEPAQPALAASFPPLYWDAARDAARALGKKLWHNAPTGEVVLDQGSNGQGRRRYALADWDQVLAQVAPELAAPIPEPGLAEAEQAAERAEAEAELIDLAPAHGLPAPAAPENPDCPLDEAELSDLSRLGGWERQGERRSLQGLPLLKMALMVGEEWGATEERTPGGWRIELANLRAAEARREANRDLERRGIAPNTADAVIPADWDVWRRRAGLLGGELALTQSGGARLTLGDRAQAGVRTFAQAQAAIEAAERAAGPGEQPCPVPAADLLAAQRRAQAIGAALGWHGGRGRFELRESYEADDVSAYPDWEGLIARLQFLEQRQRNPVAAPAETIPAYITENQQQLAAVPNRQLWNDGPEPAALMSEIEDEDGRTSVMILTDGMTEAQAEAVTTIAHSLRLLALGQAHAVDTIHLDQLGADLAAEAETPARGTLIAILEMVAGDADELARAQAQARRVA